MSDLIPPEENQDYQPKLRFLRMLCILTFAGSGLGLFSYGVIGIFYNLFSGTAASTLGEDQQELIKLLMSGGRDFFLLNALLYAGSLGGAYFMYNLRRVGFHLYTVSQLVILILPMIMIKGFQLPWMTVFLTAIFILAYSAFLRRMN